MVFKSNFRWFHVLDDLHDRYGDYVRVGPRELSISDPDAITPVLGLSSKTTKGPFYGSLEQTVHTTRDRRFHRQRRRVWDNGFKESLALFGPRIEGFTDSLLNRIEENTAQAVAINEICEHYSYDVMSALAFGKTTGFTEGKSTDTAKKVIVGIRKGVEGMSLLLHVPWILSMLKRCSRVPSPMKFFNDWSAEQVELRRRIANPEPDLMGHLMKNTPNDRQGKILLDAEARLIIGAGSDTTGAALSLIFIYLAMHPSALDDIRKEMDAVFAASQYSCLRRQPVLDSVLNEVLRLHPPVLFGAQRVTPPEGLQIGAVFVPGNAVVSIPPYRLARDPRNYAFPDSFIPERWTSRPELVRNRAAFIPFSTRPYNCAGKNLAMTELRSVVARVTGDYDVGFPVEDKFDEEAFFERMTDHFTIGVPRQNLIFSGPVSESVPTSTVAVNLKDVKRLEFLQPSTDADLADPQVYGNFRDY
ncbi:Uu.00g074100.m01.CDS01 [Anthostomella pinea]|uniref:Uu.00g074100.m01.CDS01 n=1 Tax=Anthostomella pinea TaxID=933095 RepID=A0AAI8VW10_9PEZI|nr:Uu.00g074100.m01.CDS01 [Anthostomella pinea]